MKKLSKTKEHPLTTFRKANEARDAGFKKSLPKAGLGTIVKGLAKAYKAIKPATKVIKSTSRTRDVAGDVKFFGKNIGGGGLIGAGIGAGLTKGAELSNKSDNTKVNYNLSTGTKTVVHTGANGKKYVKVTDKDGKTFNKVMNKKTGGMVTKYQSTGEVNESSKPVRTSAKPTVARPTGIKVNGVMQPIKYVKPTVAKPVRPAIPVRLPVVTDNPMAGFEKINKPRPVGKYENAVEKPWDNAADRIAIAKRDAVKKPSPPTSNKINADKIKPSPAELAKIKAIKIKAIKSKAVASTKPVNKPKLKPTLSTVDKIKLGLLFPTRAIMEMNKKKGGAVKTKK